MEHSPETQSHPDSSYIPPEHDYFIVLDFEATCELDKSKQWPQEIIEFPSVVVDVATNKVVGKFQEYVKPVHRPVLSEFCTSLTGITQNTVDNAKDFASVFEAYQQWLSELVKEKTFMFITCGDWDLKTMLPRQLELESDIVAPTYFSKWINIKEAFKSATGENPKGMLGMLQYFDLELQGRHHSGIDDCTNIAAVVTKMLSLGMRIRFTNSDTGSCFSCGSPDHYKYDCPLFVAGRQRDWTCECGGVNFARRLHCYKCSQPRSAHASDVGPDTREFESSRRPGDWDCSDCNAHNFASRWQCYSCGKAKDSSIGSATRKPGDWNCSSCGAYNFASRTQCYACSPKPVSEPISLASYSRANRKPEDWDCFCGTHNFASRWQCFTCHKPKNTPSRSEQIARPGDWNCDSCGSLNFARRTQCFTCSKQRLK